MRALMHAAGVQAKNRKKESARAVASGTRRRFQSAAERTRTLELESATIATFRAAAASARLEVRQAAACKSARV